MVGVMKKTFAKGLLMSALVCGAVVVNGAPVFAEQLGDFALDEMVITANRYEKKELEIGQTVEVVTAGQIEQLGAQTALDAIKYTTGFETASYGNNGASIGNMMSRIMTRGVTGGSLVLVNGNPYKMRGTYDISDIPAEDIERVEIVRGGGAVAYGSDAVTGVINIITKKKRTNYVKFGAGNHVGRKVAVGMQTEGLSVHYDWDTFGTLENTSSHPYTWHGPSHRNLRVSYDVNDHLGVNYNRTNSYTYYWSPADLKKGQRTNTYDITKQHAQIHYDNKGLKANAYFMDRDRDNFKPAGFNNELNKNYGGSVQYAMDLKKGKLLAGAEINHEYYREQDGTEWNRNDWSVFSTYEHNFDAANNLTIGFRETWTGGAVVNNSRFTSQAQFVHKNDESSSLYANVGTSFKLPELHALYYTKNGVTVYGTDLKPQKGTHAEIGYKKDFANGKLRVAAYIQDIKDNISMSGFSNAYDPIYVNNDLKNKGVELNYDVRLGKGFTYGTGMDISNPKTRYNSKNWMREYAGFQWSNKLGYTVGKLQANLNVNYLANRYAPRSNSVSEAYKVKPYLLSSLNLSYKPTKQHEFSFTANNVFDRRDISFAGTTSTASKQTLYYAAPYTYMVSYKFTF